MAGGVGVSTYKLNANHSLTTVIPGVCQAKSDGSLARPSGFRSQDNSYSNRGILPHWGRPDGIHRGQHGCETLMLSELQTT